MDQSILISWVLLVLLIADCRTQFFNFDLFNIPPIAPTTKHFHNDHTTRRNKVNMVKTTQPNTEIQWKNTSISYAYEETDRDDNTPPVRAKKRKQTTLIPTLAPIFNLFMTTTQRPVRKNKTTRKTTVSYVNTNNNERKTTVSNVNNNNDNKRKISNNLRLSYNVNIPKDRQTNNIYNPENHDEYYTKPYNEITTKPYNNNNRYYNNEYTTKNPFLNRPGVKPAVTENRPPITNKPPTKRPNISQPEDNRPVVTTKKPSTPRPYAVNPIPTDPGAVVYPREDGEPEIIKGIDEDSLSDAEKRRYIDIAERMCDKYKQLNTKQLSAIPLLPSPEPVSVNVSECSPLNVPLVIGGKVVSIKEFPHAALLGWERIDDGRYSWKCGGSLISEQWILTAAHCSYEERDNTVVTGPPRVAQLGSSYMDDPGALVVRVASVVRHPKYKFPRSYYDIALLKLMQPVKFSEVIKPACLGVPPPVRDPVIAVGWGKTQLGGDLSLELRAVSIPVWDISRCREVLGTSRKMPDGPQRDSQMCAGEERGGKDTCQGDSGGPVQIQDGCVWRVVAVTSLGRSCGAPNTPGLYAIAQRAFIAATVFGDYKSNNRRNNQENSNRQNDYSNSNSNNRGGNGDYVINNDNNHANVNNNHRQNDYGSVNTDNHGSTDYANVNNHRQGNVNINTNNNSQNDYSKNNNSNRGQISHNRNVNSQNNRGENDYSNVNSNNHKQNDYAYVNNNNHRQNNNVRRDNANVNNKNNGRQNDYTTTGLYYNTRSTTTTPGTFNNHDYSNRDRVQSNNKRNTITTTTTTEFYNQDYNNRNRGHNNNNQDSSNRNRGDNNYNQNGNSRDFYNSFGNNKNNPSQSENRRTDFGTSNRNQQNYNNQNSNNHRQNSNNQDYWGFHRPDNDYYGGFDDTPVWWT